MAVACIALLSYSESHDYPFNLSDYYHPEFFQQGLVLTPSASIYSNQHQKSDLEYSNSQGELTSRYFYQIHRKVWQLSGNYSLYGNGYKTHSVDSNYSSLYDLTSGSSYVNIELKNSGRYYFSGPVFVGGQVDLRSGYNRYHHEDVTIRSSWDIMGPSHYYSPSFSSSREKSTDHSKNALVEIVFGYGGISDVTYPAVVMNMIDRIGTLQSGVSVTRNQIQNLASKIELLKRERFLDFRENRIDVIDSLYRIFVKEAVIDSQSVKIAMELLDQWDYAFYQNRTAGKEVRIGPFINYHEQNYTRWSHRNTYTYNSDEERITYQPGLKLYAQYARPLGRFYQFSTRAIAKISTQTTDILSSYYYSSLSQREGFPEASLFYYAGLAWYPNTRTSIKGSIEASYYRAYDFTERSFIPENYRYGPDYQDNRRTQIGFGLSLDYYLSRNISLQINGGLSYRDEYYSELFSIAQKSLQYNLQSSLQYQVF